MTDMSKTDRAALAAGALGAIQQLIENLAARGVILEVHPRDPKTMWARVAPGMVLTEDGTVVPRALSDAERAQFTQRIINDADQIAALRAERPQVADVARYRRLEKALDEVRINLASPHAEAALGGSAKLAGLRLALDVAVHS